MIDEIANLKKEIAYYKTNQPTTGDSSLLYYQTIVLPDYTASEASSGAKVYDFRVIPQNDGIRDKMIIKAIPVYVMEYSFYATYPVVIDPLDRFHFSFTQEMPVQSGLGRNRQPYLVANKVLFRSNYPFQVEYDYEMVTP